MEILNHRDPLFGTAHLLWVLEMERNGCRIYSKVNVYSPL